jgi:hypothetical protein
VIGFAIGSAEHIARLQQECRNSKFAIFDLLV